MNEMKVALRHHNLVRSSAFPFLLLAFAMGPIGIGAMEGLASFGVLTLPDHRMGITAMVVSLMVAPVM